MLTPQCHVLQLKLIEMASFSVKFFECGISSSVTEFSVRFFAYPLAQGMAKAMSTIFGKNVIYLELSGLVLAQQTALILSSFGHTQTTLQSIK